MRWEDYSRQFRELSLASRPHLHSVGFAINDLFQVEGHGGTIDSCVGAGGTDTLGDVEDDGREAIFVDEDFLVVRDLTDFANMVVRDSEDQKGAEMERTHLTSAKVEGRSAIRAPPKRGTLSYVVMFAMEWDVRVSVVELCESRRSERLCRRVDLLQIESCELQMVQGRGCMSGLVPWFWRSKSARDSVLQENRS